MQAFPCGLKLKCWRTSTPSPPGCPAPSSRFQPRMKSSSESGCVLSLETAECPEPLCPWRALPAHGATSRVASEDITPPSSLIRAHASDQVPPGASVVPRTPGPCRLSPVPAGGWPFPTLSLQSLRRRLDPYPAASLECTCPFLPREHRPHATEDAFGTRNCPCNATSTGSRISGLQSFVYLQAPTLARPPDCIHRSIFVLGGRAVYTTHRPGGYPFRDVASLRVRLGQLTRLDLHQLDCSLVGCSLPHPAPRQTASLRAVAYPLVQEARRWPPPSLRLVWPGRLSVVVTWRRDPTSVCWPSFPPTVPPAGAPFPPRGLVGSIPPLRRYYATLRLLAAHPPALRCLRPAVPSEHLRFAPSDARCDVHGLGLGEPVPAPRRSLRWRRRGLPGSRETHPHACHALRPRRGRRLHGL